MGQFVYYLDPETKIRITRLKELQLEIINSVSSSLINNHFNNHFLPKYTLLNIYIYIYIYNHYHHQIVQIALSSQTLSRHPFLSSITHGRSFWQHMVFTQSWCLLVLVCQPKEERPHVEIIKRTLIMSSSFLLQQDTALEISHYKFAWVNTKFQKKKQ